MHFILHILEHTIMDTVKILPFLFLAFLLIESLETISEKYHQVILEKGGKAGPIVGALLGCIPQCGFSVMASDLYSGGLISVGTLLAVFLATSDEAVLIMMSNPNRGSDILALIGVKIIIAVVAGYIIDLFFKKYIVVEKHIDDLCHDCGCHADHAHHKVLKPALKHTLIVFAHLLIFTALINLLTEWIGFEQLSEMLLKNSVLQPILAAVIGLIPNCAASVALTQLYLSDVISFASVVAGLCTSAGVGLIVLFKVNHHWKENVKILGTLTAIGALAGVLLEFLL